MTGAKDTLPETLLKGFRCEEMRTTRKKRGSVLRTPCKLQLEKIRNEHVTVSDQHYDECEH